MRLRTLLLALVLPCALAACGSSSQTTTGGAAGPPRTVTRTVARTSSSASSTGSPGASGTTTAASDACVASDLSLSFLGGNGATGHAELSFALRNTSSSSCRTGGYPGVQFLDGSGADLPTKPDHTTDDFFGHTTLRELTVAPGALVWFRLGVSHVGTGGSDAGCETARALQVIAPNDTATLRVSVHDGFAECAGKVTVSPLQPGRSAVR
jgi:hypothetical protein